MPTIGWLLFKLWPQPPFDNVADLKKSAGDVATSTYSLAGGVGGFWSAGAGWFSLGRLVPTATVSSAVTKVVVLKFMFFDTSAGLTN